MLKNFTIKKIALTSVLLFILFLFSIFPNKDKNIDLTNKYSVEYTNTNNSLSEIFLIDKNNYVARTSVILKSNDALAKAKELLEIMVVGGKRESTIPNGFRAILPVDTKVINADLNEGILKINMSKELLDIDKSNEEKMIEAIIYTLTSLDEVKGILIFIENELLTILPQTNKILPPYLTREYGINKECDMVNNKNITKTTIYYINKHDDKYYYVPVTKVNNEQLEKIKVIIDELSSGPIYQSNLMSFLNSNTKLLDYEFKENNLILKFNDYILDDINSNKIIEEVKYSIYLSLKDNYVIDDVVFMVDDVLIEKVK